LNRHGLVSDELTNGQALMHHRGHRVIQTSVIRDYAHVRVNQWRMGSPCSSLIGQFVKN